MSLYFDNAAACPVSQDVLSRFVELTQAYLGNQEALAASKLRQHLQSASRTFLFSFCGPQFMEQYEVCWTASGTDAVRTALLALESICTPGDILYTDGEHASVLAAMQRLPSSFHKIRIKLLSNGQIDLSDLESKLSAQTRYFCTHWIQSETGCIQDLAAIRDLMRRKAPAALFLVDTIQGAGKMPFSFSDSQPDFACLSGQKFGLPSAAALVFRKTWKTHVTAIRSEQHQIGRVPPPFLFLFSEVFAKRMERCAETVKHMKILRAFLLNELSAQLPNGCWRKTIPDEIASPWILHLMLDCGPQIYQGAIIVRALSGKEITIASGSACNAEVDTPSRVLRAMGIPEKRAWSGIRISMFDNQTEADCIRLAEALKEAIVSY